MRKGNLAVHEFEIFLVFCERDKFTKVALLIIIIYCLQNDKYEFFNSARINNVYIGLDSDESRWLQVVTLHERTNHTERDEEISDNDFDIGNGMNDLHSSLEHDKDLEYDFINALQTNEYDSLNYEHDYYYDDYLNDTYDNEMANDNTAKMKHYQDLLKSIDELEKKLNLNQLSNDLNAENLTLNLGSPNTLDYGILNETGISQNLSFPSGSNYNGGDDDYYYDDDSLLGFNYSDSLFQDILNDKNIELQDVIVPPVQHLVDTSEYLPELDFDTSESSTAGLEEYDYDIDQNIELDNVLVPPIKHIGESNDESEYVPEFYFDSLEPSIDGLDDYDYDFDSIINDVFDVRDENYLQDMPDYEEESLTEHTTNSHFGEISSHSADKTSSHLIKPSTGDGVENNFVIPKGVGETTLNQKVSPHQTQENYNIDVALDVKTELIYPEEYSDDVNDDYESSIKFDTTD